jgi:tripartite-type tricarboxylate transporter receptor subunit TctC
MDRRKFAGGLAIATALGCRGTIAQEKGATITLVVPYAPGGIADIVARLLAQSMSVTLNRNVIVDNKPGASAVIGTKFVQRAKPDGTTLLVNAQNFMQAPGTTKGADYDPVNDFTAVAKLTTSPYVLMVNKDVPARDIREFLEWAKAQANGVFAGMAGAGGATLVMANAFERSLGVKLSVVPYKGNSDILAALIGSQVHMTITPASSTFDAAVSAGQIKYLAVTTRDPSPAYPDLPTLRSVVPKIPPNEQWLGLFAPKSTPAAAVAQLSHAVSKALTDPSVLMTLSKNNFQVSFLDGPAFSAFIKKSRGEWEAAVSESGLKFDI